MSDELPLTSEGNGRDAKGRFGPGNRAGRGNPLNRKAQKIRAALLRASTTEDVKLIARKLIEGAKAGDLQYIREYLDRTAGRPSQTDLQQRVEALEQLITERNQHEP